jgi:hypothetical protein
MRIKEIAGMLGLGTLVATGGILGLVLLVAIALLLSVGFSALAATIPWLLWNHVIAGMFSWPHCTFLQAVAITWFLGLVSRIFSRSSDE